MFADKYKPGLHILAEFNAASSHLQTGAQAKLFFDETIHKYELAKVGEVYHDFNGGGFTAVVCLTESHLSIHTWPEYGLATFDVFLSNYQKDNSEKVRLIYADVLAFFEATELKKTEVVR